MAANAHHNPRARRLPVIDLEERRRRRGQAIAEHAPTWAEQLATCCLVLAHASPAAITASTLTGCLHDPEQEAKLLDETAAGLAAKHGLQVSVEIEGAVFTARFSRRAAPPRVTAAPGAAPRRPDRLARRLLGLLGR